MKRNSGSIRRTLQWGFTFGAVGGMSLATGILYGLLHGHLNRQADERAVSQVRALKQNVSRWPLQEWGGSSDPGVLWTVMEASGIPRHRSAGAQNLPLDLPWPAPETAPVHVRMDDRLLTLAVVSWAGPEGAGTLRMALDRTGDLVLERRARLLLIASTLLAGVFANLYARLLAQRGLAPLNNITRETGSIDYRHLEVRLREVDFPEEFVPLVVTLNASLGRLQTSFDRLGRLGAELAHELRTPLQNLRVSLEDLILRPRDLDATRDGIGAALEEISRLASLIDQVLLLARSEHPGAAISARELDLSVLLEAIAEPFCLTAEEKNVDIRVQSMPGLRLIADEVLVRRAINNLMANALRHATEGGWIVVGAFSTGREVRIWVEDNGPGIPADWVNRLGTPFERGPREGGRADGFGLGLAIVKGIMNLHGGRMVLESTVGHGTKVSLSFPKPV